MKKIFLIVIAIGSYGMLSAQAFDKIWHVGYGGGEQSPSQEEFSGVVLDFVENKPTITIRQDLDMNFFVTNSIISDSTGNLLFYTNGEKLYHKNHELMDNGGELALGDGYGLRMPQATLILPWPEHSGKYFVFCVEDKSDFAIGTAFRYHLVDMNENGGLGKVVEKNNLLVQDTVDWGRVNTTKHANGRDWWVLLHRNLTNQFYRLLVSPQGIHMDTIEAGDAFEDGLGQAVFSPDGTTYARVDRITFNQPTYIRLYDFDRCTGLLSNYRLNTNLVSPGAKFGAGISISHDSRYLYVFHTEIAAQYDLQSPDPFGARVDIGIYDGFMSGMFYGSYFLFSQLAPDGRIYVASWSTTFHWHLVNTPHRQGLESQFWQHHIAFPNYMSNAIPNLPNYRLGPLDGSPCDTLGIDNHPLARYRWEQEDSTSLLEVSFTDLSSYEPDTWYWDFGDGTHSNERYPVHSYDSTGIYEVCLIVSNAFSSDTFCQTLYLGVSGTEEPGREGRGYGVVPNPASDMLLVSSLKGNIVKTTNFRFYNAQGKLILEKELDTESSATKISLDGLMDGIYFYQISIPGSKSESGKIIVKH